MKICVIVRTEAPVCREVPDVERRAETKQMCIFRRANAYDEDHHDDWRLATGDWQEGHVVVKTLNDLRSHRSLALKTELTDPIPLTTTLRSFTVRAHSVSLRVSLSVCVPFLYAMSLHSKEFTTMTEQSSLALSYLKKQKEWCKKKKGVKRVRWEKRYRAFREGMRRPTWDGGDERA